MSMLAAAAAVSLAIVAQDHTALRAAPSGSAATHAQLAAGDLVEVRGERLDFAQVYDHRRERAGFVRASQLRAVSTDAADAPGLLAVVRFLRDSPGAEAVGIAHVAAYLKAAPAKLIGSEPFDALGVMAERLARRASVADAGGKSASAAIDTVAQYGVRFASYERQGAITLCYDGEAFRRVLAQQVAAPAHRARAALALTRSDCIDPALPVRARAEHNRWRAEVLDRVDDAAIALLDEPTQQRLHARRASVWATVAFERSRAGEAPQAAAQRAIQELAALNPRELSDDDRALHTEAALRVGAVRWAALPAVSPSSRLTFSLRSGDEAGQTCVLLTDPARSDDAAPLARRCTWGSAWLASARVAADGKTAVLAVQPLDAWTELWVFRATRKGWVVDALPPAAASDTGIGYIEFAGFVPHQPRLMVAREARVDGKSVRRFEVLRLDGSYVAERSATSAQHLTAFVRWPDPAWRQGTVSLR